MLEPAGPEFPKPLVVTIGAMKAGTSSLHWWMDLHPELSMSRRKELNYFTRPKPPLGGIRAYRMMLAGGGHVVGESSVNYTKHTLFPGVPERMAEHVPRAKFIYVLRDPVDRALSHYQHNLSHGRERRDVRAAFADLSANHYVATSRYHEQFLRFAAHFDRDQFLFLDFGQLCDDPDAAMVEIFEFIGVDATFRHPEFGKVFHDSSRKGQPNALGAPLANIPVIRHIRYALPAVFEKPLEKPRFPQDIRESLSDALAPDIAAIRAESGLPLAGWSC